MSVGARVSFVEGERFGHKCADRGFRVGIAHQRKHLHVFALDPLSALIGVREAVDVR